MGEENLKSIENIGLKVFFEMNDSLAQQIYELESNIFDQPYSLEKIKRESSAKSQLIIVMCYVDDIPAGYKIGYEMSSRLYYSWLGGVSKDQRKKGLARLMMDKQHELVKLKGYKMIRTHTQNRFRQMLLFNIQYGFDITGLFKSENDDEPTIILEKSLLNPI